VDISGEEVMLMSERFSKWVCPDCETIFYVPVTIEPRFCPVCCCKEIECCCEEEWRGEDRGLHDRREVRG